MYTAHTDETGESSVKVTQAHGGIEAGRIIFLSDPMIWKSSRVSNEAAVAPRF